MSVNRCKFNVGEDEKAVYPAIRVVIAHATVANRAKDQALPPLATGRKSA
jgi:hypothetical protein